jgi:hypothetical protein
MTTLRVAIEGESYERGPGESLSFGRNADLVVDTNRFLHRKLGVFSWDRERWWIANVGTTIGIEIVDVESPSSLTLAPGSSAPVPFVVNRVRFSAGQVAYELDVSVDRPSLQPAVEDEADSSTTITAGKVSLNPEQRQLLLALGEARIRSGSLQSELPTNREVADRLQWTITKFNRKLDNLCTKFDRLGVRGIKGDLGGMALSRRERLINHVITARIVTVDDLAELEAL